MSDKITISDISVSGFRVFLQPQSFRLRRHNQPLSLAVFAPNATGKSSLVDAFEFFFSSDGTLKRIGIRRSGTQAGREALEHVKAQEVGVASEIRINFATQSGTFEGTRTVKQCEECPDAATLVMSAKKLDFLIHGYELRHWVERQTPLERYEETSTWFGLSSLTAIERNLRDLRLRLKNDLDRNAQAESHTRELRRITAQGLCTWNEAQILVWFSTTRLHPLDSALTLDVLSKESCVYQTILDRKKQEDEGVGLTALNEVSDKIQGFYLRQTIDGSTSETGAVVDFESAANVAIEAADREQDERTKSANAVFGEVWDAASKVFENTSLDIETCPVCDTPLEQTTKGSREGIAVHLKAQIAGLESYNKALNALRSATDEAQQKHRQAITAVSDLRAMLKTAGLASEAEAVAAYVSKLEPWAPKKLPPDSSALKGLLLKLREKVDSERQRIQKQQGEHTYAKCLAALDQLIQLKLDVDENKRTCAQMEVLLKSFTELETTVGTRIRTHVQEVIDTLKDSVNTLYCAVHADETEAPAIRLDLATETKQPQLNLLVDFAPNRQGSSRAGI